MRHYLRLRKERIIPLLNVIFAAGLVLTTLAIPRVAHAQVTTTGPSAFCHETDGTFTICPDGKSEWSDITPAFFPESNSFLYADQADLDPVLGIPDSPLDTFVLMYDECSRTVPLGPNEYFLVSFKTIEVEAGIEKMEHYVLHLFSDGTIIFFENGVIQSPGRAPEVEGQRGAVGFGRSPNCSFDHVIAEFQVPLTAAGGGSYSPDPLFWSSTIPPRQNVVALFTGFSGSSGDNIGMEEIRQLLLQNPDVVIDARRFGHSQQRAAVQFLRSHAGTADIVLIGHSFGGDSTIEVAERLRNEGLSVDKLVQLDSVGVGDDLLPGNVSTGLNYFQTGDLINGEQPVGGSTNVNAEVHLGLTADELTHTNIDNNGAIQAEIVDFKLTDALPTGAGVTPPNSPTRNVSILGPLTINGSAGLLSNTLWDSSFIPFGSPITLSGKDGVIIDVDFSDPVLMKMADTTGFSQETLTVELFGTVITPDTTPGSSDVVELEFQFDDFAEELRSSQAFELVRISGGTGILQQSINLTDTSFHFGGFTLEILQNGTGVVQISGFRVVLQADDIVEVPEPPPPPGGALTPFRSVTIAGDYVVSGIGLRNTTGGSINFSNIPAGATVIEAVLYWGMLDNGESSTLKNLNFNGTPITGTLIGSGPDTCWGRTNSFAYRADVTPFVPGNGIYTLSGVASGGAILAQGASLVVLYERPGDPLRTVIILDGDVVFPQVRTATITIAGFLAAGPVSAKTTFVVGDGQLFSETASFTGSAGNTTFANPFDGSDGPLWDTDTFDVSLQVGPGDVPGSVTITMGSDCLMWVAQIFSVSTAAPVDVDGDGVPTAEDNCPIVSNSNQQDSNLNGIGDACETPALQQSTAAFLQALATGNTSVESTPLFVGDEPELSEQLLRILEFRVDAGLTDSAAELTMNLVGSLVEVGLVPPAEADELINTVLQQFIIPVAIDIKPGSEPNALNPKNRGLIPVAILTTPVFDATTVDPLSVEFGSSGAHEAHNMGHIEDVDGDGDLDLILHFRTQETGIQCGDTSASLTGETFAGQPIQGLDSVVTVGCR